MSEFANSYASFWGVAVQSELTSRPSRGPSGLIVSYKVEVLEGFEQAISDQVSVISSVVDGGSCGVSLNMGNPQFISAYKRGDGKFSVSSCTPEIPYASIKLYLETGADTFIPKLDRCLIEQAENNYALPKVVPEKPECGVWNTLMNNYWERVGREDWPNYLNQWRARKWTPEVP